MRAGFASEFLIACGTYAVMGHECYLGWSLIALGVFGAILRFFYSVSIKQAKEERTKEIYEAAKFFFSSLILQVVHETNEESEPSQTVH